MAVGVWALVSGCASNVSVDYDRAIKFNEFKTYSLLPKSEASTADARLNSVLIDKRIASAIEKNLGEKGFQNHPEKPDFHVRYQINRQHEIAADNSGVSMAFGTGLGRSGFGVGYRVPSSGVESYEKGILTIDIIAAETEQLLWRGTSSRAMAEASTPDDIDRFFHILVKEILDKFPPQK